MTANTPTAYRAERVASLAEFLDRCDRLAEPVTLPFHRRCWLEAWYSTIGASEGRSPVLLAVRGPRGDDVMMLPLSAQRRHGFLWLDYADAGVVDYVAPLLAPHWADGGGFADDAAAARAMWFALEPQLADHDVLCLDKLLDRGLPETGHRSNPLVLALPSWESELAGNQFEVSGTWDDWRRGLDKRVRKEIERCWRVFHRSEAARFARITDPADALELLTVLETQQSERLGPVLGEQYKLDLPAYRAFYRRVLATGMADGHVVMTALLDGEQVVSALFGVANAARYIGLRQSLGGDAWKSCSPGRLLDEQSARHMHEAGRRHFDFGVGEYFHKTTLQMAQIPLRMLCHALSWRGTLAVAAWHAKRRLKQQPQVMAAWRQIKARQA